MHVIVLLYRIKLTPTLRLLQSKRQVFQKYLDFALDALNLSFRLVLL